MNSNSKIVICENVTPNLKTHSKPKPTPKPPNPRKSSSITTFNAISPPTLRNTAEIIYKNLDKLERKITLVDGKSKVYEKILDKLSVGDIKTIEDGLKGLFK